MELGPDPGPIERTLRGNDSRAPAAWLTPGAPEIVPHLARLTA